MRKFWTLFVVLFFASSVAQAQTPTPDPIGGGGEVEDFCGELRKQIEQLENFDIPAQEERVRKAKDALDEWASLRREAWEALVRAEQTGSAESIESCRRLLQMIEEKLFIAEALYQFELMMLQILQLMRWFLEQLSLAYGCQTLD